MQTDNWHIDTPSFYLGSLSMGALAILFLITTAIWDAFKRRLSEHRTRAERYGRHSQKVQKAPKEVAPCDAPETPPTVIMPALKPSSEAGKRPSISSGNSARRAITRGKM